MIDAITQDPSLVQITIVITLLITVAIWRQLHKAALAMVGIYLLYIVFILVSAPSAVDTLIEKDQFPSSENLPTTMAEPIIGKIDEVLEENGGEAGPEIIPETLEISEENILTTQDIEAKDEAHPNEIENPVSKIENVVDPDQSLDPIIVNSMAFGTELVNRELVTVDSVFYITDDRIYTLSKIQNRGEERILFHKWYHEGKLRSKIRMEVGRSYGWRTWSYIDVRPNIIGNWEVFVSDSLGVNYDSLSFQIKAPTVE